MKINWELCSSIVAGKIVNLKIKGQDFPTIIEAQYEVNK